MVVVGGHEGHLGDGGVHPLAPDPQLQRGAGLGQGGAHVAHGHVGAAAQRGGGAACTGRVTRDT